MYVAAYSQLFYHALHNLDLAGNSQMYAKVAQNDYCFCRPLMRIEIAWCTPTKASSAHVASQLKRNAREHIFIVWHRQMYAKLPKTIIVFVVLLRELK